MIATSRKSLRSITVLLFAFSAAMAGCDAGNIQSTGGEIIAAPCDTVSVYQLAGRLGLRVRNSSAGMATLCNDCNTVVVFADPDGQVFVNGRQVGARGGIAPVGDIIFLPRSVEREIRSVLRNGIVNPVKKVITPTARLGTVVIDAGHGGKDPGAHSVIGHDEKDIVLSVALAVAQMLRDDGVDVRMTRDSDHFVELDDRATFANRASPDLFVSIHADSARNRSARGSTVYISRSASCASRSAADKILSNICATSMQSRGVQQRDFRVLVRTSCPAVLVEMGYLSNPTEARMLADPQFQRRMARAIADGIVSYLRQK